MVLSHILVEGAVVEFAGDSELVHVLKQVLKLTVQNGNQCILLETKPANIQGLRYELSSEQLKAIHILRLSSFKELQNSMDIIEKKQKESCAEIIIFYSIYSMLEEYGTDFAKLLRELQQKCCVILFNDIIEVCEENIKPNSCFYRNNYLYEIQVCDEPADSPVYYCEKNTSARQLPNAMVHPGVTETNYGMDLFKLNGQLFYIAYDFKLQNIPSAKVVCIKNKEAAQRIEVLVACASNMTPMSFGMPFDFQQ